jgi:hypothetical protein
MKLFSLISMALIIASCGPIEPQAQGSGGQGPQDMSPRFLKGTQEEAKIQAICSAMDGKESVLQEMKAVRKVMNLDYKFKNCFGNKFNFVKSSIVSSVSFGEYAFVELNNNLLPIPSAETLSSGVMKEICAHKNDLISPIVSGRKVVSFAALSGGYDNCTSDNDQTCVQVTYGEMNDDGKTFTPKELHWVSFKTSGSLKGFYDFRMKRSYSENCPNGEEMVQTFK